ncbi:hypothetical protein L6164_013424 [Bauhinia variegata]|uniref:Uncharacterized protein n=1 Tax=Bauhinia variegata TaxID=167791 RepID=A0ACB9NHQ9_BAUVA|nr:hypothetical protein L6164_013424 [Bauhinia variegata]
MALLPVVNLTLLLFISLQTTTLSIDPTVGFTPLPLDSSYFQIQTPYDLPQDQRYSFKNGVHKFWVYSTDKPFMSTSNTAPRSEIRILYDYTSGIWQFEGYGYVPSGSTGVCIMQVFGGSLSSTSLQLRVYNGALTSYRSPTLVQNIYDRWFRVNVIHDAGANTITVYIDGELKYQGADRGDATHYFKFGVYEQNDPSNYMESQWKGIKVFKK